MPLDIPEHSSSVCTTMNKGYCHVTHVAVDALCFATFEKSNKVYFKCRNDMWRVSTWVFYFNQEGYAFIIVTCLSTQTPKVMNDLAQTLVLFFSKCFRDGFSPITKQISPLQL